MELKDILMVVISYFLGCFNTGYYYTKLFYKQDIRSVGTNVTGATNVKRVAGKKGFIITFLGDALKGAILVILCRRLALTDWIVLLCILLVIAGHIFPVQLRFRGGKGFSTLFGAFLAYQPMFIVILFATCIVIYPFVRRFTITGLFALSIFPIELAVLGYGWFVILFVVICIVIVIFACRENLIEFFKLK